MRRIIIVLLLLFFAQSILAQTKTNFIAFTVRIDTSIIYGPFKAYESITDSIAGMYCRKDVSFSYSIKNLSKTKLKVPSELTIGESHVYHISFDAERKIVGTQKFIKIKKNLSLPTFSDEEILGELRPGEIISGKGSISYTTQINELNRIRFTLNLSRYSKYKKLVTTDWIPLNYHYPDQERWF